MSEMFFDIQGTVYMEFTPEGHIVDRKLFVDILRSLRESIRRRD